MSPSANRHALSLSATIDSIAMPAYARPKLLATISVPSDGVKVIDHFLKGDPDELRHTNAAYHVFVVRVLPARLCVFIEGGA